MYNRAAAIVVPIDKSEHRVWVSAGTSALDKIGSVMMLARTEAGDKV